MEILDKETQSLAVEKVFEEMKLAEEILTSWGVSWSEYFSDAYITPYRCWYETREKERKREEEFEETFYEARWLASQGFYGFEYFLNDHITLNCGHYYGKKLDIDSDSLIFHKKFKNSFALYNGYVIPEWMGNYKLANGHIYDDSIGVPLKNETLIDHAGFSVGYLDEATQEYILKIEFYIYEVKFGRITWGDINSHGSQRRIIFNNDGTIELDKHCNLRPKRVKYIDYTISFNVLSNDFDMLFNVSGDKIMVSLKGDTLVEKFNNIEITKNLNDDSPLEEQAEKSLIEIIKSIRGEIPLPGLVNRIDNFLERIDKNYKTQKSNKKVLKLELPTNN